MLLAAEGWLEHIRSRLWMDARIARALETFEWTPPAAAAVGWSRQLCQFSWSQSRADEAREVAACSDMLNGQRQWQRVYLQSKYVPRAGNNSN